MNILITGAAGFIGFHLSSHLLKNGHHVIGIDNLNDYYNPQLKKDRLLQLQQHHHFTFYQKDICDPQTFKNLTHHNITHIIHLAAQAGVRYSLINPQSYVDTNITGTLNVLEFARHNPVEHMMYASSSSVYGTNKDIPFTENQVTDTPISLYAASKKTNELMAHAYAHLFDIALTGFRFFTVYGPWGRPDMAIHIFATKILNKEPIPVFNHGNMHRDFTYIDDIIYGLTQTLFNPPVKQHNKTSHEVLNIGAGKTEKLMDMIHLLETYLDTKAIYDFMPMQPGDVTQTYASREKLISYINDDYPTTSIQQGLKSFCTWYTSYYNIKK